MYVASYSEGSFLYHPHPEDYPSFVNLDDWFLTMKMIEDAAQMQFRIDRF